MNYIYSTLSNSQKYCLFDTSGQMPRIVKSVVVTGGANVADRRAINSFGEILTPKGLVTPISDEDLEWLEKDYHFQEHIKSGCIKVDKKEIKVEKAIETLKKRDESSPKTPEDYKEDLRRAAEPDLVAVPRELRK